MSRPNGMRRPKTATSRAADVHYLATSSGSDQGYVLATKTRLPSGGSNSGLQVADDKCQMPNDR
jgi:hypothetical protein